MADFPRVPGHGAPGTAMPDVRIYQIFYSPETRDALDKGFIGLDNTKNERPDWREYWPIRNYLLRETLDDNGYYGFLSPKFGSKTGLGSSAVFDFVAAQGGRPDVILFSPFFDQIAYPANVFEQSAIQHQGILPTFRECVKMIAPEVDFDTILTDSSNTVFCNYFVAQKKFWMDWLARCEIIFRAAEEGGTDIAARLNGNVAHETGAAPAKVFVIERVASLMLASGQGWTASAYAPTELPWSAAPIASCKLEMVLLDALKLACAARKHPEYLNAYYYVREMVDQALNERKESAGAVGKTL